MIKVNMGWLGVGEDTDLSGSAAQVLARCPNQSGAMERIRQGWGLGSPDFGLWFRMVSQGLHCLGVASLGKRNKKPTSLK